MECSTSYPTGYPIGYEISYPISYEISYPIAYAIAYPISYEISYPISYAISYPIWYEQDIFYCTMNVYRALVSKFPEPPPKMIFSRPFHIQLDIQLGMQLDIQFHMKCWISYPIGYPICIISTFHIQLDIQLDMKWTDWISNWVWKLHFQAFVFKSFPKIYDMPMLNNIGPAGMVQTFTS